MPNPRATGGKHICEKLNQGIFRLSVNISLEFVYCIYSSVSCWPNVVVTAGVLLRYATGPEKAVSGCGDEDRLTRIRESPTLSASTIKRGTRAQYRQETLSLNKVDLRGQYYYRSLPIRTMHQSRPHCNQVTYFPFPPRIELATLRRGRKTEVCSASGYKNGIFLLILCQNIESPTTVYSHKDPRN